MKKYRVFLVATLPCSATLEVYAADAEQAAELANEQYAQADWEGADYSTPQGCDVIVDEVEEIQ